MGRVELMAALAAPIVSRAWSFCTTLRDNGVRYGRWSSYSLEELMSRDKTSLDTSPLPNFQPSAGLTSPQNTAKIAVNTTKCKP